MKDVKDFMRDFFRSRIAEEEKYQKNREPFRREFFTEDCRFDSHADTLRRMQSEKVLSIEEGEGHCKVITEQTVNYKGSCRKMRLRYTLQHLSDRWLIQNVKTACLVCEGRGDKDCPFCKGNPWLAPEMI
jgi:redox-regulated HSP33 family molecular chaperone